MPIPRTSLRRAAAQRGPDDGAADHGVAVSLSGVAQPFRAANAGLKPCATVVKPLLRNADETDVEHERRVRRNLRRVRRRVAVREIGWDDEAPPSADAHPDDALI